MPSIVIVGSVNVDMFFRTGALPSSGETVIASAVKKSFGGKGANQAVAVARLGGMTMMVCRIGNDAAGKELFTNFKSEGVDTRHVIHDPETTSGMAFVTVDNRGENTIVIHSGANMKLSIPDLNGAMDDIRSSDLVVAQLEIPIPTVKRAAEISHENNIPFILNPAPAPSQDIAYILKKVDVLCPNETEAEALTGGKIRGIEDAKRAGIKLMKTGVKNVVLTLGSSGAVLVSKDGERHFPCPRVNIRDTTGAGDAFVGAFAFSLGHGSTISESVKFANVAAAISVTKDGAQSGLPALNEVNEVYHRFYEDD